jgi:hypothetical protein
MDEKAKEEIPHGYCQCGCGEKTKLIQKTQNDKGDIKGEPRKFISGHQNSWKGGRYITEKGYVMVLCHGHPRANNTGHVFEHILIAEKALGGPLPPRAVIHHYGEKTENTKIVICPDQEYHCLLHVREKALKETGHADWRKCKICKKWDEPSALILKGGRTAYHLQCSRDSANLYYKNKKANQGKLNITS